jgi:hypothetical protein
MHELDEYRSKRALWLALFSGMATGYLGLIGIYFLVA